MLPTPQTFGMMTTGAHEIPGRFTEKQTPTRLDSPKAIATQSGSHKRLVHKSSMLSGGRARR